MIRGRNIFLLLYHNIVFLFSIIRNNSYHHIGFLIVAIFANRYLLSSYSMHKVISALLMFIINVIVLYDVIKTIKSDDVKYHIIPSKYGILTVSFYIVLSYLVISFLVYMGLALFYTDIQEILYVFIATNAAIYGLSCQNQVYNIKSILAYSVILLLSLCFAYINLIVLSVICLWITILMSSHKLSKYLSL